MSADGVATTPAKAPPPDDPAARVDLPAFLARAEGMFTPEEGLALSAYAARSTDAIVEIGAYRGMSAVALAHGARSRRPHGHVFSVEPHEPFIGVFGGRFGPEDRAAYYRVMLETGCYRDVSLVNLRSTEAAGGWQRPIGLLLIDGDHTYDGVRADIDAWGAHVVPGGVVAFDDSVDPQIGPYRVIRELVTARTYEPLERVGKVTFLRKAATRTASPPPTATPARDASTEPQRPAAAPTRTLRVAVACHDLEPTGGLLRFERFGRAAAENGHEVVMVVFGDGAERPRDAGLPVMGVAEAERREWDVVMVPGAGFPEETIRGFERLRAPRFGVRIQHVLNDQSRREAFLRVNAALAPHLVVFNNAAAWPPGSFTDFMANQFHVLEGAVDTRAFTPDGRQRPLPDPARPLVVGGQTHKNAGPLLEAARTYPGPIELRLMGSPAALEPYGVVVADLVARGRLTLTGRVPDGDLPHLYAGLDCVVSTEGFAGWCNVGAEALAAGVALVCTEHGTQAFAEDGRTALVLPEPTPAAIERALRRIHTDPDLVRRLAREGRERIEAFPWDSYARGLLALVPNAGRTDYTSSPRYGLHGKWPLEARLHGLEPALEASRDGTVLDLGAGDGAIARSFLDAGAALVHAFEFDAERVASGTRLIAPYDGSAFRQGDLSSWPDFVARHGSELLPSYDVVLFLGLYHHLPEATRRATLLGCAGLATEMFVIRTPERLYTGERLDLVLARAGFELVGQTTDAERIGMGGLHVFRRSHTTSSGGPA